jgi:hypothetical protein
MHFGHTFQNRENAASNTARRRANSCWRFHGHRQVGRG